MISRPRTRILLLDLYPPATRPFALPFLYLGAFLDMLDIEYRLHRCLDDRASLLKTVEREQISHVFINVIMGPVLAVVEPICHLLKEHFPDVQVWVGGVAVRHLRPLFEASSTIDRVSDANPCEDPEFFMRELYGNGLLSELPRTQARFPSVLGNRNLSSFLHRHVYGSGQVESINLVSSSGCVNRCAFCYLGQARSWAQPVPALVSDLVGLRERRGVGYVEFGDDNFPANRARLDSFCSALKAMGGGISYFCLSSVDVLDAGVLDQMCASGLKRLLIGVDGLGAGHIEQLNKSYTAETARKTIDLVRTYPVDLTLGVVLGTSGETRLTIQELYDWVASVGPEESMCSFLTPYPGTETYRQALNLGFRPPKTLAGWGALSALQTPKGCFNPSISVEEYRDWCGRFCALSTRRYRSGIGESVRRL